MKLILIFMSITKKKLKVDKNEHECILFRTDVYFIEYFLPYKIMIKTTKVENVFLKKKDKSHYKKKNLAANLLELIQVMQKRVMIQIMKLVKYKHLSVNLKKKNKIK